MKGKIHELDLRGDIGGISLREDFVGRQLFEHWLQKIVIFLLAAIGLLGSRIITRHF